MEENSSNTTPEQRQKMEGGITGKGFVKGDARINRNGRPKSFDQWRKLTVDLLREIALDGKGNPIILRDAAGNEHKATNAEMIARSWIQSPKRQRDVIEAAFGKVPDRIESINLDVSNLDDEQLERLARGDDLRSIIATAGASRDRKTEAEAAASSDTGNDQ